MSEIESDRARAERMFLMDEADLIANLAAFRKEITEPLQAEIARLRTAIEPGTQASFVKALFDLAEKYGMSPLSSEPPNAWLDRHIAHLTRGLLIY